MGEPQDDILELIVQGRKIEAVKLAREVLGMSLVEAKQFVDGLEQDTRAATANPPVDTGEEVDRLLLARKKIEAVKAYRERAGCGLKEAKDAIELRAVELGLQSRPSKCFVATAACGGGEQADVMALRRFRNRVLRRSVPGRVAIAAYETLSPPVAWVVGRNEYAASVMRFVIRHLVRVVDPRGTTRPPR